MLRKFSIMSLLVLMMSGCASIAVNPQANHIVSSPNPAPKGCKYLGEVTGNQGNFFTGGFTSNKNLEQGARNDLRNQAAAMGANYVQIVTTRGGNTGSYNQGFGSAEQTNVTYAGNAYSCPSALIGL